VFDFRGINPNHLEVRAYVRRCLDDAKMHADCERLGNDFAISCALRLFIATMTWIVKLVGPATAQMMIESLVEGLRHMHRHSCDDPTCPLYIPPEENN